MSSYTEALNALNRMANVEQALRTEMLAVEGRLLVSHFHAQGGIVTDRGADYVRLINLRQMRHKHTEWGRKIFGVMAGYLREMEGGTKNLDKGRLVEFERADVTVGQSEPYAKAVQYKHTISDDLSDVDSMIAKGANQLTGETGEVPHPDQRKAIDVTVASPHNWWPLSQTDLNGLDLEVDLTEATLPFDWIKQAGCNRVLKALDNYKQSNKGLDPGTRNTLFNHVTPMGGPGPAPALTKPFGAGPKSTALMPPGGKVSQILTVKVSYLQPRTFDNHGMAVVVNRLHFAAYRQNGALHVEFRDQP